MKMTILIYMILVLANRQYKKGRRSPQFRSRGYQTAATESLDNSSGDRGVQKGDKLESPDEDLLAWKENLEETRQKKKS